MARASTKFGSTTSAVECENALQRAFGRHADGGGEPIVVRMGLNVGEPIEEDGDFFGSAVILGARINDQAAGGEILVPEECIRGSLSRRRESAQPAPSGGAGVAQCHITAR